VWSQDLQAMRLPSDSVRIRTGRLQLGQALSMY